MFALKKQMKAIDRLKKRSDFLHVQKHGRKWVSKSLIVEVCDNESNGVRYGITVSKKFSKKAVLRNRFKRRLKAVAYDVLPAYQTQNLDVVIVARATSEEKIYQDFKNELVWCLKKMSINTDVPS